MKLYHYTSLERLDQILADGELKLTRSNLVEPKSPHLDIKNRRVVDETDNIKPVVWFTSSLDFDKAALVGFSGSAMGKTEVAIQIETGIQVFHKWDKWAISNGIEETWFQALKKTAPLWDTFYICEHPVKIDDYTMLCFRPDIAQAMRKHN